MKKHLLILSIAIFSTCSMADQYAGGLSIGRVRVHTEYTYIQLRPQPSQTCSNWGEHLRFENTTVAGKNFMSTLLAAKAADKKIDVWYTESDSPGTNQSNGCGSANVSILTAIAIR